MSDSDRRPASWRLLLPAAILLAVLAWWPPTLVDALQGPFLMPFLILMTPALLLPGPAWLLVFWLGWEIGSLRTLRRRPSGDDVFDGTKRRKHQANLLVLGILLVPIVLLMGVVVVMTAVETSAEEIGVMEGWSIESYSIAGLWLRSDPKFMARYRAQPNNFPFPH